MSPTGVSLRRRLPSPENDTSFFPSESLHDGEDLDGRESVSACSSPLHERLKDEASCDDADDGNSCEESGCSESKSSLESGEEEEEDDESTLGENLIGRKVLVCPLADDDSLLDSLDDDQSCQDEDERLMSEDERSSSSSESEDDSDQDPEELSETEKVSRIPRSFIVGKKYYGTKQPRSFDSDEMSSSSVDSDESSTACSEEGARGLGLALDDALSALSDESFDDDRTETESSCGEEDEVSSVFESDDEDTVSEHHYGDKTLQSLPSELNQSNVSVFVSMEDELKQALNENKNEYSDDDDNIGLVIARDDNRRPARKDSISIEDLEEIINESSSSDSEIDFSDDEEQQDEESNLSRDSKIESQHSKIKRQFSEENLSSLNWFNSSTSPKRFRSSSESSSTADNEDQEIPTQHFLSTDSGLPPLPWLSLGPSQTSKEVINNCQSLPTLSPHGDIYDKVYQDNQIELELSEELYFSNKSKAPNEYSSEVVALLTPPHQPQEDENDDFVEWPSNLAVDTAMTEVALSARPLSPQSLQDDKENSVNAVSLDATDCSASRMSPPPSREFDSRTMLTPKLQGLVSCFRTVR